MAATYTAVSIDTAYANNKSMLTIFNGSGSGVVLRIYRIWTTNSQLTGVTGVVQNLAIRRLIASSGGTTITPVKHDTNSSNLPAQVLITTNATDTVTDTLRICRRDNDEPAVAGTGTNELAMLFPLNLIWESGYYDTTIEPLVLREGEGITVRNETSTTVGSLDVFFEFTSGAS